VAQQDVEVALDGETLQLSASPSLARPAIALEPDLVLDDFGFAGDVAELNDGTIVVLDRLAREIRLFSAAGEDVARYGREGEGPGEYVEPYAVAGVGNNIAVWDRNGRLTILDRSGRVVSATAPRVVGDTRAIFQRLNITQWFEPFQQSREDVTRRLAGLDESHVGLALQSVDERFDTSFVTSKNPHRFPHHVMRFDSLGQIVDTVLQFQGQELTMRLLPSSLSSGMASERPFPLRPLWTSGDGWVAYAQGGDPSVRIRWASGREQRVEWPRDEPPLSDAELESFIDWEIEGYRRTKSIDAANRAAEISRSFWLDEVSRDQRERDRPQIMGLLGDGPCLGIIGLSTEYGPHGEAPVVVIINVVDPTRFAAVEFDGVDPGFLNALTGNHLYRISTNLAGIRAVERASLPAGVCDS